MTPARLAHLESVAKDVRNQAYLDAHAALPELLKEIAQANARAEQWEANAHEQGTRALAMEAALRVQPCRCGFTPRSACSVCGSDLQPGTEQFEGSWVCAECHTTRTPEKVLIRECVRCSALTNHAGALAEHDREKDAEIARQTKAAEQLAEAYVRATDREKEKDAEIASLRITLTGMDAEIARLTAALTSAEATILDGIAVGETLRDSLNRSIKTANDQSNEIARLRERVAELEKLSLKAYRAIEALEFYASNTDGGDIARATLTKLRGTPKL